MVKSMYYIYILFSKTHQRYYIGSTGDIVKRLQQHNIGATRSTKPFRPWVLVYQEIFETKTEARKRELQIKKYKGGRAFKRLLNI
ncbi:MAG: GIY-YIG nuclease family protein [Patescibacteria group bacterium]